MIKSRLSAQRFSDETLMGLLAQNLNYTQIAEQLGVAVSSVSRRAARLRERGYDPQTGHTHIAPDGFKIKGTSTLYDKDGNQKMQWVKTTIDDERRQIIIEETLAAIIQDVEPALPKKPKGDYLSDIMTAYPFGDPHIGMQAWAAECGHDWDLVIAEDVHRQVIADLVDRSPASETALLINLGDLLHYDSMEPKTARSGNMLDADGRYAKMIRVAVEIMVVMIETCLTKHKEVRVVNVIGNHDETGALWMALLLHHRYLNEPRVIVETSPSVFVYHRFGKNLIGMHHGHSVRQITRLPSIMAADKAKDWGETEHRYWYTGHVHHQQQIETPGCIIETFGTLATADAYATNGGWRSKQVANAVVLHKDAGEISRIRSNPQIANVKLGKSK